MAKSVDGVGLVAKCAKDDNVCKKGRKCHISQCPPEGDH